MKRHKYKILCLLFSLTAFSQQQKSNQEFIANEKKIAVYTTAADTKLRLSPTDNLLFSKANSTCRNRNINFCGTY